MVKSTIVAIVVSDVHLGAIGSNKPQFKSFIKRLMTYPKLHLILAGDFMDLMCEPISHIDEGAQEIFRAIQTLQEKGTEICWLLGNHEIPVTGPYDAIPASLSDENFRERMDNFKLKLTATKNFLKILPKVKFGQYALLEKSGNSWEVQTYDSILRVQLNPASECHALVAHGFQFDNTTPNHCETWKNAIDSPDSLKDIMDFFFNAAIRQIRNVFKPSKWEAGSEAVKNAIQTHKNLHKHTTESTSLIQMIDEHPTQVQEYSLEYMKTITKRDYNLPTIFRDIWHLLNNIPNIHDLSHVIFGHTHEMQVAESPGNATIINTGGWQHVRKMTYIEIDNAGNFYVKQLLSRTYLLNLLLGISLVAGIIIGILAVIII